MIAIMIFDIQLPKHTELRTISTQENTVELYLQEARNSFYMRKNGVKRILKGDDVANKKYLFNDTVHEMIREWNQSDL